MFSSCGKASEAPSFSFEFDVLTGGRSSVVIILSIKGIILGLVE